MSDFVRVVVVLDMGHWMSPTRTYDINDRFCIRKIVLRGLSDPLAMVKFLSRCIVFIVI